MIYRVAQESLSNVPQHSGATRVEVELSFVGRHRAARPRRRRTASTRANRNGRVRGRPAASASPACASARCWSAATSTIFSAPGAGTTIELTMGAT